MDSALEIIDAPAILTLWRITRKNPSERNIRDRALRLCRVRVLLERAPPPFHREAGATLGFNTPYSISYTCTADGKSAFVCFIVRELKFHSNRKLLEG